MLAIIYFTIILFCLGASFLNKVSRQNNLWIYFLSVVFIEIGIFTRIIPTQIYIISPLIYISFFTYYFGNQKNSDKKLIYTLGIISLVLCLYFLSKGFHFYSIEAGIVMNLVYIIFALQWLLGELMYVDENSLLKKQAFWFSFSLLLWSVFFLFRLIPMNWFAKNDTDFLNTMNLIYQQATILSYCLFLRGLFCKI
jgi:hypothetical protein